MELNRERIKELRYKDGMSVFDAKKIVWTETMLTNLWASTSIDELKEIMAELIKQHTGYIE